MDSGFNMLGQFQGDSSLGLGSFQGNSHPSFASVSSESMAKSPSHQLGLISVGYYKDWDDKTKEERAKVEATV